MIYSEEKQLGCKRVQTNRGSSMNPFISPRGEGAAEEVAEASVLLHSWPLSADGFSETPPDIFALG
jgi:hypothetical protein